MYAGNATFHCLIHSDQRRYSAIVILLIIARLLSVCVMKDCDINLNMACSLVFTGYILYKSIKVMIFRYTHNIYNTYKLYCSCMRFVHVQIAKQ